MTGRPKDPSYTAPSVTIPVFAPNANYPVSADPWSGTPCKTAHSGASSVGLTPKTGVAAQVLNKLVFDAYATDAAVQAALALHVTEEMAFDTALADHVGQIPALSFGPKVASTNTDRIKFVPGTRTWFALSCFVINDGIYIGGTDPWLASAWPGSSSISGALQGVPLADAAGDDSGGFVCIYQSASDLTTVYNGTTWSQHNGVSGRTCDHGAIVYEPVSGNYIYASKNFGASSHGVATTPYTSRTVWTTRTPPAGIVGTAILSLGVDRLGNAVMCGFVGTSVYFSKSTDGGVTWSAATSLTLPFSINISLGTGTEVYPRPHWTGSMWVVAVPNTSTAQTAILTSPDGLTWTQASTLSTAALTSVAGIGDLLVASNATATELAIGLNGGTSWHRGDRKYPSDMRYVSTNGLRFAVGSTTALWVSSGCGVGLEPLT